MTLCVCFAEMCVAGPGLAIRVICADEPYICKDFAETNNILKIITDFSASVKKVCVRTSLNLAYFVAELLTLTLNNLSFSI